MTAGHPGRSQLRPESPSPAHSPIPRPASRCLPEASGAAAAELQRPSAKRRGRSAWSGGPADPGGARGSPVRGAGPREDDAHVARPLRLVPPPRARLVAHGRSFGATHGEVPHGAGPLKRGLRGRTGPRRAQGPGEAEGLRFGGGGGGAWVVGELGARCARPASPVPS